MAKQTKPQTAPAGIDWGQQTVTGFDNVRQDDLGIPFLSILQKGSPEVDKGSPEYKQYGIKGADSGDIMNSLAHEIIYKHGEDPIVFIPCGYQKLFNEWTPRDKGGGLVRVHKDPNILAETTRNERNQDMLRNGNVIVTTSYFYGFYEKNDELHQAVIGMSSTQQKKARAWLNLMTAIKQNDSNGRKFTPPMFSHKYALSTSGESNAQGSWFGWNVEIIGPVTDPAQIPQFVEVAQRISAQTRVALPAAESTDGVM